MCDSVNANITNHRNLIKEPQIKTVNFEAVVRICDSVNTDNINQTNLTKDTEITKQNTLNEDKIRRKNYKVYFQNGSTHL